MPGAPPPRGVPEAEDVVVAGDDAAVRQRVRGQKVGRRVREGADLGIKCRTCKNAKKLAVNNRT